MDQRGRGGTFRRLQAGKQSSGVGRAAAAEGPVFLRDFDQGDQYVIGTYVEGGGQPRSDAGIQRLLRLDTPAAVERDLDDDEPVRPLHAAIRRMSDEVLRRDGIHDLELV